MTEVYLALGANVGDAHGNIAQAINLLGSKIHDLRSAPVYTSTAVGYTDQPDFVNTAVSGRTDLPPRELLKFVKGIEQEVGRVERFRWGPREIDIDIILYGDQLIDQEGLTIPHREFRKRDFVLQPLVDLNPGLIDPVSRQTVRQLLDDLPADQRSLHQS